MQDIIRSSGSNILGLFIFNMDTPDNHIANHIILLYNYYIQ